jgi:hypothetical protein
MSGHRLKAENQLGGVSPSLQVIEEYTAILPQKRYKSESKIPFKHIQNGGN